MSLSCVKLSVSNVESFDFESANTCLANKSAQQRVEWALKYLPQNHVLASSFGAQSAVSLHMLSQAFPNIPVVLVDTGYLFQETYQFIDELTERLNLNLNVYRSSMSPAWQETRYGQLWTKGLDGIKEYNQINKVEPMQRALNDLDCSTWFAGLRRDQASSRENIDYVRAQGERFKVHPIADWTDKDIYLYLQKYNLPYHPLWEKGYVSIGDVHTTRSLKDVDDVSETRFFGLKRECGIHEI